MRCLYDQTFEIPFADYVGSCCDCYDIDSGRIGFYSGFVNTSVVRDSFADAYFCDHCDAYRKSPGWISADWHIFHAMPMGTSEDC